METIFPKAHLSAPEQKKEAPHSPDEILHEETRTSKEVIHQDPPEGGRTTDTLSNRETAVQQGQQEFSKASKDGGGYTARSKKKGTVCSGNDKSVLLLIIGVIAAVVLTAGVGVITYFITEKSLRTAAEERGKAVLVGAAGQVKQERSRMVATVHKTAKKILATSGSVGNWSNAQKVVDYYNTSLFDDFTDRMLVPDAPYGVGAYFLFPRLNSPLNELVPQDHEQQKGCYSICRRSIDPPPFKEAYTLAAWYDINLKGEKDYMYAYSDPSTKGYTDVKRLRPKNIGGAPPWLRERQKKECEERSETEDHPRHCEGNHHDVRPVYDEGKLQMAEYTYGYTSLPRLVNGSYYDGVWSPVYLWTSFADKNTYYFLSYSQAFVTEDNYVFHVSSYGLLANWYHLVRDLLAYGGTLSNSQGTTSSHEQLLFLVDEKMRVLAYNNDPLGDKRLRDCQTRPNRSFYTDCGDLSAINYPDDKVQSLFRSYSGVIHSMKADETHISWGPLGVADRGNKETYLFLARHVTVTVESKISAVFVMSENEALQGLKRKTMVTVLFSCLFVFVVAIFLAAIGFFAVRESQMMQRIMSKLAAYIATYDVDRAEKLIQREIEEAEKPMFPCCEPIKRLFGCCCCGTNTEQLAENNSGIQDTFDDDAEHPRAPLQLREFQKIVDNLKTFRPFLPPGLLIDLRSLREDTCNASDQRTGSLMEETLLSSSNRNPNGEKREPLSHSLHFLAGKEKTKRDLSLSFSGLLDQDALLAEGEKKDERDPAPRHTDSDISDDEMVNNETEIALALPLKGKRAGTRHCHFAESPGSTVDTFPSYPINSTTLRNACGTILVVELCNLPSSASDQTNGKGRPKATPFIDCFVRTALSIIRGHRGVVDQFEATRIIASFNHHQQVLKHEDAACKCAMALRKGLERASFTYFRKLKEAASLALSGSSRSVQLNSSTSARTALRVLHHNEPPPTAVDSGATPTFGHPPSTVTTSSGTFSSQVLLPPLPLEIAISIASGVCLVGTCGNSKQMAKVVCGEPVDLAVKLISLQKQLGIPILVAGSAARKVSTRRLGLVPVDIVAPQWSRSETEEQRDRSDRMRVFELTETVRPAGELEFTPDEIVEQMESRMEVCAEKGASLKQSVEECHSINTAEKLYSNILKQTAFKVEHTDSFALQSQHQCASVFLQPIDFGRCLIFETLYEKKDPKLAVQLADNLIEAVVGPSDSSEEALTKRELTLENALKACLANPVLVTTLYRVGAHNGNSGKDRKLGVTLHEVGPLIASVHQLFRLKHLAIQQLENGLLSTPRPEWGWTPSEGVGWYAFSSKTTMEGATISNLPPGLPWYSRMCTISKFVRLQHLFTASKDSLRVQCTSNEPKGENEQRAQPAVADTPQVGLSQPAIPTPEANGRNVSPNQSGKGSLTHFAQPGFQPLDQHLETRAASGSLPPTHRSDTFAANIQSAHQQQCLDEDVAFQPLSQILVNEYHHHRQQQPPTQTLESANEGSSQPASPRPPNAHGPTYAHLGQNNADKNTSVTRDEPQPLSGIEDGTHPKKGNDEIVLWKPTGVYHGGEDHQVTSIYAASLAAVAGCGRGETEAQQRRRQDVRPISLVTKESATQNSLPGFGALPAHRTLLESSSENRSDPTSPKENAQEQSTSTHSSSASVHDIVDVHGEHFFKTGKTLGSGTFGTVDLVIHETGCLMAMKRIPIPIANSAAVEERLVNEVDTLRKLNHQNIAAYVSCAVVLAAGSTPPVSRNVMHFKPFQQKHYFFVFMEYLSGGSLRSILNAVIKQRIVFTSRRGPTMPSAELQSHLHAFSTHTSVVTTLIGKTLLPPRMALNYFRMILEGLKYLHTQDPPLAHCDIKPDNVLMTADGTCKIADFGAVLIGADEPPGGTWQDDGSKDNQAANTKKTIPRGTPAYIPPEAIHSSQWGPEADIFAAGMMLVELSTGRHPWMWLDDIKKGTLKHTKSGDHGLEVRPAKNKNEPRLATNSKLFMAHMAKDASMVPVCPDWVDPVVKEIARRCLSRDPKERPTAEELLNRLQ